VTGSLSGWQLDPATMSYADMAAYTTAGAIAVFTGVARWALYRLRERWT
jgi:hypothetical protein